MSRCLSTNFSHSLVEVLLFCFPRKRIDLVNTACSKVDHCRIPILNSRSLKVKSLLGECVRGGGVGGINGTRLLEISRANTYYTLAENLYLW